MAKYDPQRPRPAIDLDEPAPVDALLDDLAGLDDVAGLDDMESDGLAGDDLAGDDTAGEEAVVEPTGALDMSGPDVFEDLVPTITGVSDVPVAAPPQEGTANRAVLGAVAVVAAAGAVVAIFLRRRRSH